jgi:glycosyltransferase involved in cell wall biosynthesis
VWPKWLGGNMTRRYVHRKIRSRWQGADNRPVAKTPLVSVIIPVWNGAVFLPEALRSLQAQTYAHFEAVIVDDGSTDNTAAVARRFCETDSRFIFVQQAHAGVSAARNAAIARSRGEYVAFLDADDVWSPKKLTRQLEVFAEDPRVNAVFTNFYMWDGQRDLHIWYRPEKPLPEGDVAARLVFNIGLVCAASMSVAVLRRELFDKAGFFDPELTIGEDWDLFLRMAECGLWVRVTREPLARYRRWSGNVTNQKLKTIEGNVRVLQKNFQTTRRPELRPLYEHSLAFARAQFELGRARQFIESRPDAVPAAIWRAWRIYPRKLKWLMWFALVAWPKFLGGNATARIVHRKLVQKW